VRLLFLGDSHRVQKATRVWAWVRVDRGTLLIELARH
jgi:hypothetical protein